MTGLAHNDDNQLIWMDDAPLVARSTADRWRDWIEVFREIYRAAEALSKTPLVPKEMLGKTADVAAAMMKGYELGLDPLDALGQIYVIHGRIGFYAEFMRRRIIQAGHTFRVVESTDNRCIVEGIRKEGGEPQRATFTAEQARKAQLQLGAYPADKLLARATSRLCRQVFPDVLSGTLIAEDIMDGLIPAADAESPPPAVEAGPALKRARKPRPVKAASTQPPEQPAPVAEPEVDDLLDDDPPIVTPEELGAAKRQTTKAEYSWADYPDYDAGELDEPKDKPEQAAIPPDDVRMITDQQMKLLQIRFKERGFTKREERLDYASTVIGRALGSSGDLTAAEASKLIDSLEN